jgi:hypothetical protein
LINLSEIDLLSKLLEHKLEDLILLGLKAHHQSSLSHHVPPFNKADLLLQQDILSALRNPLWIIDRL